MLEDAEHDPCPCVQACLAAEIECPDEISWHGFGPRILDLPAHNVDFVSVLTDEFRDKSLTHSHSPLGGETPVEDVRDGAAAAGREEGFEANDFLPDPFGLGRRAGKGSQWRRRAPVAGRVLSE